MGSLGNYIHNIRERALFYMQHNRLNQTEFIKTVGENEITLSKQSAFSRFLSGESNSENVLIVIREFLEKQGYWPEIKNMDTHLSLIANFFDGNEALPDDVVKRYCRNFCYYQHSTNSPGKIATSKLTIRKPHPKDMEPTYLVVEEVSSDPYFTEVFKGVLFRKGSIEVMLLRLDESDHGKNKHGPKMLFSMKTGVMSDDVPQEKGLVWLSGRLLKTSAHDRKQHECNWFAKQVDKLHRHDTMLTEETLLKKDSKAHEMLFNFDFFKSSSD